MSKNSKTKIIALLLASNMVMSATSGLLTVTASATTDTTVSATNVATEDIVEDGQIIDTQTSNFTNVGAEGYSFTINGNGVITGFTHTDTTVTDIVIPSTVNGTKVTGIGEELFYYYRNITSVTIPESVKSIGRFAFYYCLSLTTVTIPEGVTSIGEYAFYECSSLTSVTIPSTVTEIGYGTFGKCTNLTDVYYNGLESQWNKISIPGDNDQLKNATKHFKTYEFTVDSNGVITSFTHLDKTDTDIVIPSTVNGTKVTGFYDRLFYCNEDITSVTISEGITSISTGTFMYCANLSNVTLPSTLTTISENAFYNCSKLKDVYYNGKEEQWKTINIGDWNDPLNKATKHFKVACEFTINDSGVITSFTHNDTTVTEIVIPSIVNGTKVTGIGSDLFKNKSTITSVTISEGITSIGDYAFAYCTNLTSVTIPSTVTSIGNAAFGECRNLTSVTISEGVTSISGYAFAYCTNLTSVTLPSTLTSIGYAAFGECTNLTSLTIKEGITAIGDYVFYNCTNLQSITIPESVTSIGYATFGKCTNLTSLTIKEGIISIGDYAFAYCTNLTSVTIPEGATSICYAAFYGCSSLSNVTIPSTVTTIGVGVFGECPSLTDVYYNGTQEQWQKVQIDNTGDYNKSLLNATKHYNEFVFVGANLTLQNNISVNYYVDKLVFDKFGYTDLSATFTLNDRTTVVNEYTTSADGKYYVFTFSGIAPQMMGDTITATLSATYNGEKVTSEVKEYSILQYCNNQLKESNIKAEFKTLIVDLLNYGSMAQKGVNYNTDKLVNAGLTADEQQAFVNWATTKTYTSARNVITNVANPTLNWKGVSLNLNDSIDINVYFTMANADVKSIVVKDANDNTVDTITKFVDAGNNEKMAKFNKLIVSQLSDIYTFIAYDNNGEVVSNTLTYSVESYAYAKQNSTNIDLVNLINAMMKYGESAKAYAETL